MKQDHKIAIKILKEEKITPEKLNRIGDGESGSRLFSFRAQEKNYILKISYPRWFPGFLLKDFPCISRAEYYFYKELYPPLKKILPKIYRQKKLGNGGHYILLKDLSFQGYIPGKIKNRREWEKILNTYAFFHARSPKTPPNWANPPLKENFIPSNFLELLEKFLVITEIEDDLLFLLRHKKIETLAEKVQKYIPDYGETLIHNDFFPGNLALCSCRETGFVFDWQLVSWGSPGLDLSQMKTDFDKAYLQYYWKCFCYWKEKKFPLESLEEDYFFARLLNSGAFLPSISRAFSRAKEENRPLSPWMFSRLKNLIQTWKISINS